MRFWKTYFWALLIIPAGGCEWSAPGANARHLWEINLSPNPLAKSPSDRPRRIEANAITQRRDIINISFSLNGGKFDREQFIWNTSNFDNRVKLQGNAVVIRVIDSTTENLSNPSNQVSTINDSANTQHFLIRSKGKSTSFPELHLSSLQNVQHPPGGELTACYYAEDGRRIEELKTDNSNEIDRADRLYRLVAKNGLVISEAGPLDRIVYYEKYIGPAEIRFQGAIIVNGRAIDMAWSEISESSKRRSQSIAQ